MLNTNIQPDESMDNEDLPVIGQQSECLQINSANKKDLDSIYLSSTLSENWITPIYLKRTWQGKIKAYIKKLTGFDPIEEKYFLTYHKEEFPENLPNNQKSIKPEYDQVGDEILKVIISPRISKNRPRIVFIARMEVSQGNMEYIEKAYLPLEKLLGTTSPDLVVVDVGTCLETISFPREEVPEVIDDYAIINGEINFRVFKRLIYPYEYRIQAAADLLAENKKLRDWSIANGLFSDLLESNNLLILKRLDLALPELWQNIRRSLHEDKALRLTTTANMINSFATGIHEGALIFPVIAYLDQKLQIWVYLSIFIQYLFYNFTPLMDIKLSTRADEWFEAMQGKKFNQHLINQEMRTYQRNAALFSIVSVSVLTLLFPPFFHYLFGSALNMVQLQWLAVLGYLTYLIFNLLYFSMDSIVSQTLFRQNKTTNRILTSVSAFEKAGRIVVSAIGFGLGWLIMSLYPGLGIIPAIIFGMVGCLSKYLFPIYGSAARMTVVSRQSLLKLDNYNFSIIPDSMRLKFKNKVLFTPKSGNYLTYVDNPEDISIILDTPQKADLIKIKEKKHIWFNNKSHTWILSWNEKEKPASKNLWKQRISFQLHTQKHYQLKKESTGSELIFTFERKEDGLKKRVD